MAGAAFAEAHHLVADCECRHAGPDVGDHSGQVAALPGRERGGPDLVQHPRADLGLAGIDPRGLHLDEHLALTGHRTVDLTHLEHVDVAV